MATGGQTLAIAPMAPGEKVPAGVLPPSEAPDDHIGSFLILPERSLREAVHDGMVIYEAPPDNVSDEVVLAYMQGLPAPEFRRIKDPTKEKIVTPLDERGLVDTDALIAAINETITLEYRWPGQSDRHHKQWTAASYSRMAEIDPSSRAWAFRELSRNKIRVPRIFHNWLHAITLPPPMPTHEVMQECIEEAMIISNFFRSVSRTWLKIRAYEREERQRGGFSEDQREVRDLQLRRLLGGVMMHIESLYSLPPDRLPFDLTLRASQAAGQVGDVVRNGWERKTKAVQKRSIQQDRKVA